MKYKGEPIDLDPECEEVANFYAQVIGTDWGENLTFRKNFFKDFLKLLKKKMPGCTIKKFEYCDFTPLTEYFAELKEKKKAMTKEEKEVIYYINVITIIFIIIKMYISNRNKNNKNK
jgi:DNA topoisomerase-1